MKEEFCGTIVAGSCFDRTITIKLDQTECMGHVVLGKRVKIRPAITKKMVEEYERQALEQTQ